MANLPRMPPYSTCSGARTEMLPETIDDLLDVAKSGEGETAGLSSAVAMMQFASPCLVLLASGDGSLVFSR